MKLHLLKAMSETERFFWRVLLLAALVLWAFAGCTTPGAYYPPVSVTPSFLGVGSVKLDFGGYTVPAQVVSDPSVVAPVLKVPASAPITSGTVPVTTASGATTNVPVVVAPVTAPILAVPAK